MSFFVCFFFIRSYVFERKTIFSCDRFFPLRFNAIQSLNTQQRTLFNHFSWFINLNSFQLHSSMYVVYLLQQLAIMVAGGDSDEWMCCETFKRFFWTNVAVFSYFFFFMSVGGVLYGIQYIVLSVRGKNTYKVSLDAYVDIDVDVGCIFYFSSFASKQTAINFKCIGYFQWRKKKYLWIAVSIHICWTSFLYR